MSRQPKIRSIIPQLWIIAGPNGAGKSSLVQRYKISQRIPIVNPDVIAVTPGLGRLTDLDAGRRAIAQQRRFLVRKQSFAIETTLSGAYIIKLMKDAKAAGYKVNLIFMGIESPLISVGRVRMRVSDGGHNIPSADLYRRFPRSLRKAGSSMTRPIAIF